MELFDIRSDNRENRVYCILKGYFLGSEIELVIHKLNKEISTLIPGFDAIIDIEDITLSSKESATMLGEYIEKMKIIGARYILKVNRQNEIEDEYDKFCSNNFNFFCRYFTVSSIKEAETLIERLNSCHHIYLS